MAHKINKFSIISGAPIRCNDISVRQPTLHEIRQLGYDVYNDYVAVLHLDRESMAEMLNIKVNELPLELNSLQFITQVDTLRESFIKALAWFTNLGVFYDDAGYSFMVDGNALTVGFRELQEIRDTILATCGIESDIEDEVPEFTSEKARRIWEKCQKYKRAQKKANKHSADMELWNVIGSVCAYSNSYNLLNIWGLTVLQLYDQFSRIDGKVHTDIIGQRWAAWGKDDFDFSFWYKVADN